ncbi:hypothetical protein ACFQPA_19570 [Halomarina halobia]|uniref:Uncharacterized protein n=1 Tax=Halomarina halobia TaxID=3033386 RepID=A0ABD6AH24_9EURY|nr:hypothetical protein [Halomarina sp. PSR21]
MNDSSETTAATETEQMNAGFVTVAGGESVDATVERIKGDIEGSPLTFVTTVDHAKNAAWVDRTLPPPPC